ncbi:phage regulatory protein/antirepressor Ant [Aeromonas veronii]|uniref:phage antirepressor KilAC domain-containing protein n=1 Tax=Aeromonas veronii TaxID=654 RepID=UPI0018F1F0FB|nr:phage regulatory protein/antirepressor Ant [Aeromonas veronii]MBJ7583006.1 phage regulatory protein/antirepressor Ant [Aeromonas veronii]
MELMKANANPVMSSVEIADLTGKRHDNVMADIRKMLTELYPRGCPEISGVGQEPYHRGDRTQYKYLREDTIQALMDFGTGGKSTEYPFEGTYINEQNGQSYKCFNLPKRECLILIAGYKITLRARIIDRWQELEQQANQPAMMIPQTLPEALRLAAELAEQKMELERKVALDAPAVEFAKQIASIEKGITLSAFAKTVGLGPTKLFATLRERKILMSCRGERWNLPMQEFVDRGYFATRESTYSSNGEKRISFTPLITGKGQQWLVERLIRDGVLRGVAA